MGTENLKICSAQPLRIYDRREWLYTLGEWATVAAWAKRLPGASPPRIDRVLLVHFTHHDFGFTDDPTLAEDLHRRYLDIALDAAWNTKAQPLDRRFYWTLEALFPLSAWWRLNTPARRRQFVETVHRGQIDVTALPLNQTPLLNSRQWDLMTHWIPEAFWLQLHPSTAMQDDVNGFPRAGAIRLMDRGISRIWTGINSDMGGAPMATPTAFWWKMPDGRRLFVWLGLHYGAGYYYFYEQSWRRGPVPHAADTAYRPPRAGEIFATAPDALHRAHRRCVGQLESLSHRGYPFRTIVLPITNQWRLDNDPPFPGLADFVAAWNDMHLKPTLQFTTVSGALASLELEIGGQIAEYAGEWTDWWANGVASAPRAVAASRHAKRILDAVSSPVWGGGR